MDDDCTSSVTNIQIPFFSFFFNYFENGKTGGKFVVEYIQFVLVVQYIQFVFVVQYIQFVFHSATHKFGSNYLSFQPIYKSFYCEMHIETQETLTLVRF